MQAYLVPFLAYALSGPITNYFLDNLYISYAIRTLLTGVLIFYYRKEYKLKFKLDFLSFFTGILIFFIWIFFTANNSLFGNMHYVASDLLSLSVKLIGFLLVVPLIEELFVRSFLIRFIISRDWKKVPVGKFTWPSFIITALLFGFSHYLWLAGIITGILLNLLLYKQKRIESCIFAHFIANLSLAIYILATSSWYLW